MIAPPHPDEVASIERGFVPRRQGFAEAVKAHHAANAGRSSGQAMAALLGQYARGIALSAVIAEEHIAPHLDELTADGWQGLAVGLETFAAELRRRIRAVEVSQ